MLATLGFWSVTLTRLHAAIRKGQGFVTWDFKSQRRSCVVPLKFCFKIKQDFAWQPIRTRGVDLDATRDALTVQFVLMAVSLLPG